MSLAVKLFLKADSGNESETAELSRSRTAQIICDHMFLKVYSMFSAYMSISIALALCQA